MKKHTVTSSFLALAFAFSPFEQASAQTTVDFNGSTLFGGIPVEIEGEDYVWLCMDVFADEPTGHAVPYTLSTNPGGLLFGRLAGLQANQVELLGAALVNIYLNNQSAILSGSGYTSPAFDFQAAAWYFIEGAIAKKWTNTLDAAVISSLADDPDLQWLRGSNINPGFGDLIRSGSSTPAEAASWNIFYGAPSGSENDEFQPILFFSSTPVPEPPPSFSSLRWVLSDSSVANAFLEELKSVHLSSARRWLRGFSAFPGGQVFGIDACLN